MKNILILLLTVVIWTTVTISCGPEKSLFEEAKHTNTVAAYENVNQQYLQIRSDNSKSVKMAYQHLVEVMDKFHKTFDVYTDDAAAGNHFIVIAKMASDGEEGQVDIDVASTENPHSGATCIKNTFTPLNTNWGGCYFQNGFLFGKDRQPRPNWGEYPGAGYNLTGAIKTLTFWGRGKEGGEQIEFFAFGVGRDATTNQTVTPYPDSSPKTSFGHIILSKEWKQYSIDLDDEWCDLRYIIGGFGWATSALYNNPDGDVVVFYLDDIQYLLSKQYALQRQEEPRFLVSYNTIGSNLPFDTVMRNVAFTYDNAMALLAFIAVGDKDRANLLADAFVYAQNHDRYFSDGRLRNAYQAGDLCSPPGWRPNNRKDTARLPGIWDIETKQWHEDYMQIGSYTGNIAWGIIALLSFYDSYGGSQYLDAAVKMGEWIQKNCYNTEGLGGYTGGYDGWGNKQNKVPWASTEHNLDLYCAFTRLQKVTGDKKWEERAEHAKRFVETMWSEDEKRFYAGSDDGATPNKNQRPLDVNTWALLVFGVTEKTKAAIEWVENNCSVTNEFEGFDFNDDHDGIWWEGTAQMLVVYKMLAEKESTLKYLKQLRRAQSSSPGGNGTGIVAASRDGLTTGLNVKGTGADGKETEYEWLYYRRLHVGATAWFIFAELGGNPYW